MSFKLAALAAFLASVTASPVIAARENYGPGSIHVVNKTPHDIPYVLTGEDKPSIKVGVIPTGGGPISFPDSVDKAGFVVKMAGPGGDPSSSSNILQLEYTYNSANAGGAVSYDWSDVNGPDPYTAYPRSIVPTDSSCATITCAAGKDVDTCEFVGPSDCVECVKQCAATDDVIFTATIG